MQLDGINASTCEVGRVQVLRDHARLQSYMNTLAHSGWCEMGQKFLKFANWAQQS